jgi:hypothetical protein
MDSRTHHRFRRGARPARGSSRTMHSSRNYGDAA